LLEKRNKFTFHGGWNASIDDRLHKSKNIIIPKDRWMAEIMRFGAYHANAQLIKLWLDEHGRVMNKLLDMVRISPTAMNAFALFILFAGWDTRRYRPLKNGSAI